MIVMDPWLSDESISVSYTILYPVSLVLASCISPCEWRWSVLSVDPLAVVAGRRGSDSGVELLRYSGSGGLVREKVEHRIKIKLGGANDHMRW